MKNILMILIAISMVSPANGGIGFGMTWSVKNTVTKIDKKIEAKFAPVITSIQVQWVSIPGGSFMMGAADLWHATPVHQVTVPSFQMARTLVTNKQYRACVTAGACTAGRECGSQFDGDDQPVVCVDWYQAKAFSAWVGGRLPSEAEWEYAARSAGQNQNYPWGNATPTCSLAVFSGCTRNVTATVCSTPAGNTAQGLCDMAGNAWEWVEDTWHSSYSGAPTDGSAWEDSGSDRVNRGGSWNFDAGDARSANRNNYAPGYRNYYLGFRPAR